MTVTTSQKVNQVGKIRTKTFHDVLPGDASLLAMAIIAHLLKPEFSGKSLCDDGIIASVGNIIYEKPWPTSGDRPGLFEQISKLESQPVPNPNQKPKVKVNVRIKKCT